MLSYAGQSFFANQNAAQLQQDQSSTQRNPELGLPLLSGSGTVLVAAQQATALNSNINVFQPALTQQASGSQATGNLERDRPTMAETALALSIAAMLNMAKLAAAFSPMLKSTESTAEEE